VKRRVFAPLLLLVSASLFPAGGASGAGRETGAEMETLIFKVPPGFASVADPADKGGVRKPQPGFKPKPSLRGAQYDASEYLRGVGIHFPPGGEAIYDEGSGVMVVRNTRENLELVEDLFGAVDGFSGMVEVVVDVTVSECHLPAGGSALAPPWLTFSAMAKLPQKEVRAVDRVAVETKSGIRASARHVASAAYGKTLVPASREKPEAGEAAGFAVGEMGTIVSALPVVGPDGKTVDVVLSFRSRMLTDTGAVAEIAFDTNVASWDGYSVVLNITPSPADPAKSYVVTACVRLVNLGGWPENRAAPGSVRAAEK